MWRNSVLSRTGIDGSSVLSWIDKRKRGYNYEKIISVMVVTLIVLAGCSNWSQPIGRKTVVTSVRSIADKNFGAEIITDKGKVYKFDDTLPVEFRKTKIDSNKIKEVYLANFVIHTISSKHQRRCFWKVKTCTRQWEAMWLHLIIRTTSMLHNRKCMETRLHCRTFIQWSNEDIKNCSGNRYCFNWSTKPSGCR